MEKCIIGYDPGGNKNHGLCKWELGENGKVTAIDYPEPLDSFQDVMNYCEPLADTVAAIGIDTFTSWSTGPSGWRPADKFLRSKYPKVQSSVLSLNSTFSSMSVNGMMLLKWALEKTKALITEAHPKVCYHALTTGKLYDKSDIKGMYQHLSEVKGRHPFNFLDEFPLPSNEHHFDACIAALVAYCCYLKIWKSDLHHLKWEDYFEHGKGEVTFPFGRNPCSVFYSWPEE